MSEWWYHLLGKKKVWGKKQMQRKKSRGGWVDRHVPWSSQKRSILKVGESLVFIRCLKPWNRQRSLGDNVWTEKWVPALTFWKLEGPGTLTCQKSDRGRRAEKEPEWLWPQCRKGCALLKSLQRNRTNNIQNIERRERVHKNTSNFKICEVGQQVGDPGKS